jgi:DNA-binding transcriptional regulator YhcF (GntR family)
MPTQAFRVSPTGRGAVFRAKRWFYSMIYRKAKNEVRDLNLSAWKELAKRIIDEMSKADVADKPVRLSINYELGEKGEFKPISAVIEVIELKPVKTITVPAFEKTIEEEKERLKAQLAEMLKKAKELGISLEELT